MEAARLADAIAIQEAGAFSMVLELMPEQLAPADPGGHHRHEHHADSEQVVPVETRLSHLGQRADRLGFTRDRHEAELYPLDPW